MNLRYLALFGCILGAVVGCKTTQPPSSTGNETPMDGSVLTNRVQKAVPIDQQAFTVVANTNQLDPQWLRSPTNLFKLGPGDVIEIEILGEAASRSQVLVGPDGKIYFGLLPGTFVWGLTLGEAKKLLDESLQKFFREQPQVALTLRSVASQRIWILGNVSAPGVYPLATPLTLLDAISLAGGTVGGVAGASDADLRNSFVMREGRLLPVDFYRLLRKGELSSQNIYLQADDFVYVRPGAAQSVHVLGAVARSGAVPFVDKISLLSAVASSGGTVPYAQFWDVAIIRGSLNNPSVTSVNYRDIAKGKAPDVLLEPGDIVYVPFSPFRKIGELADYVLKQFVSTLALNEGIRSVNRGAGPVGITVGLGAGLGSAAGAGVVR